MAFRINSNIPAQNAYRSLQVTSDQQSKALERLSSGFRINRASDDASGLTTSEQLRSLVGGIGVSIRNAQDGIGVIQTAEGALTEVHSILQRMRDLAVAASNEGAVDSTSTGASQSEVDALNLELDRISDVTRFGNTKLLDGNYSKKFVVGAKGDAADQIDVTIAAVDSTTLGVDGVDLSTLANSTAAIGDIDTAIATVSAARGSLGAIQNRLEHTINNLSVTRENLAASESRIRDADMAEEMVKFTRSQIMTQAGTAMLAQANQAPSAVLALLK